MFFLFEKVDLKNVRLTCVEKTSIENYLFCAAIYLFNKHFRDKGCHGLSLGLCVERPCPTLVVPSHKVNWLKLSYFLVN